MTLDARKRRELERKLESVTVEFKAWTDLACAGKPLEKHQSQIARVTAQLSALAAVVRARLSQSAPAVAQGRPVELMILEIHRIWDFFREKLLQRRMEGFAKYLAVADELAWAFYEPARKLAEQSGTVKGAAVKEPPLVFLNGASSPFALSRDVGYQAEDVPYEGMTTPEFAAVLGRLPIPVIGVPWFQVEHLPDMLVIAHEVAHNIEDDFRLTATIEAFIDSAEINAGHRPAWSAWAGEIFADIFGTVALGPAFVGSLVDFLAGPAAAIQSQRRVSPTWRRYPTDWLRIRIVLETLRQLEALEHAGFEAARATLENEWRTAYPSHAMPEFEADVKPLVTALIDTALPPLSGKKLREVAPFKTADEKNARDHVPIILNGREFKTRDIRQVLAAARLAYEENGPEYERRKGRVLDWAFEIRTPGVRATAAKSAVIRADDEAAGRALADVLAGPAPA